jgi:predicted glycogen debranching enzyme
LRGTRFNIHVDPNDGLLAQGEEGYQLTWMDAKMGDWVVTPRRGKAVEINALWYNALCILANWLREIGDETSAQTYDEHAERARVSFNNRFWYSEGGYLYDVVDVDGGNKNDPSCRPNQLFAISLDHPVLDAKHWKSVVEVVEEKLLTPVGLRTLSPDSPDYKPIYAGDLRSRDGAYHQGTVWAWLIGPFIDSWLKVYPLDRAAARKFLETFPVHLSDNGIGTISEVFDASEPHFAGGCIAQAWSVAEVLRAWSKTA